VIAMGKAYVRWAVTHPDYYQVMFASELDNTESPEVVAAGERAFNDLLGTIVRCQSAGLLPAGNPRDIAGPVWSLLHGVSTLTIGGHLTNVGIREEPERLVERSLSELLF
jgi:hypothetical protein